jgi:hypothetical protein
MTDTSDVRIAGSQGDFDLALAHRFSQAVRDALAQEEDAALRMPLWRA